MNDIEKVIQEVWPVIHEQRATENLMPKPNCMNHIFCCSYKTPKYHRSTSQSTMRTSKVLWNSVTFSWNIFFSLVAPFIAMPYPYIYIYWLLLWYYQKLAFWCLTRIKCFNPFLCLHHVHVLQIRSDEKLFCHMILWWPKEMEPKWWLHMNVTSSIAPELLN